MPNDESCVLVSRVADEIMAYLRKNTFAGDTARGIWQWWLTGSSTRVDLRTVEIALERLAALGAIGVRVLASGEPFYFGLGPQNRGQS